MTLAGCSSNASNVSSDKLYQIDFTDGVSLSDGESADELDWMSTMILEKGKDFLKSSLSSLTIYTFKTACAEMGIDVRDATTKKLDQIISKLDQMEVEIKAGFSALTNKMQQVQDYDNMNTILKLINEVRTPILAQMTVLEEIALKENDPSVDKDALKAEKEGFIDGFKTKLNFYGLSNELWHSTEMLADQLISPNQVKKSQSLMDLYDNTLGANDVWDYQSYAPRMAFIKECAFLVNCLGILSKIECAKEISSYPEGDSRIDGVKYSIEAMCQKVNAINEVFQKELKKLETIKENHDDYAKPTMSHLKRSFDTDGYVHISADYTVSAYLATVTVNDLSWSNTIDDTYDNGTSHCFKTFVADNDFYNTLYSDYLAYKSSHSVSADYNLKYYLKDLGFKIPSNKQVDLDEAIGIYKNIDVKCIGRGFLRGRDYYAYYNYYDWNGNAASKDYCRVGETFWNNYDDEQVYQDNIAKKMVAFLNADNATLLGHNYWTIAHRDSNSGSQLLSHFYRGSKANDSDSAPYSLFD